MTKAELYEQLRRFQARKLPGWTNAECRTMTEGWHPKFAHIDADLCRDAVTIELGREGFPSVDRVLARATEAQREREPSGPPVPRVYPQAMRIHWRANDIERRNNGRRGRLEGLEPITLEEATRRATAEIEAEEAGKGGA